MFAGLLRLLRLRSGPGGRASHAAVYLPSIPRDEIPHLLTVVEGLPQVDWGMAAAWITRCAAGKSLSTDAMRRAVAAAWLDELRDALTTDSRRWRSALVEGLAPLSEHVGPRVARAADQSLTVIGKALTELRGDPRDCPIPPVAVIVLGTADEYYSFISHHHDQEGEYATSGGVYLRQSADEFPSLVINAQTQQSLELTVAHELTHHALRSDRRDLDAGMPIWVEEGLAQIMEHRVTGASHFVFDRETLGRHRAQWEEIGFEGFLTGETFHSPHGEEQELSYNLSEALTRSLLSRQPKAFFAFVRSCREDGADVQSAAVEHLGQTPEELAEALVFSLGD